MSVTTAARTAFDLGRRAGPTAAAVRLDALANATGLTAADVEPLIIRNRGARGLVQLRGTLAIMDGGAESPQETRTRLTLLKAGLRRPQTQIAVRDKTGYSYARIDMGYEEVKVGVEYDGEQHWTDPRQRAYDIERHVALTADGWVIVRVSSDLLRNRPWLVVRRVVEALRAADCPWLSECGVVTREPARRVS